MNTTKRMAWTAGMFLTISFTFQLNAQTEVQLDQADFSVMTAADLIPLSAKTLPHNGTFWVLLDPPSAANGRTATHRLLAPFPTIPPGGGKIFQASRYRSDIFLVDQRMNQQLDADLLSVLVSLRIQIAASTATSTAMMNASSSVEMSTMTESDGPPVPGEGGYGENTENGGLEFGASDYDTNQLWMSVRMTNSGSASLMNIVIHPAASDTNLYWDVLLTTNLTTATPANALNLTNWFWAYQTAVNETNLLLDTTPWPQKGFVKLGNAAIDSDHDGLSDAVENLSIHSDSHNWSSGGDGVSDGWKVAHGITPYTYLSANGLNGTNVMQVFTPFR